MIRALEFAQKADLILPQLQRLRGSISVPRLATRIGAISARWLFRSGHQEEAVLGLDCLGPPNQLSDTLAIWLVVRNYDLSEKQRESLLSRAIEVAACDEEKHLARLELASYYLANGKSRQALSLVKAIVDETASGKASDERLSAMVLKWAIIGDDTEFPPAFEAMKGQTEDTDRIRNGVLLIDRGKYGEAEEILGKLASNGSQGNPATRRYAAAFPEKRCLPRNVLVDSTGARSGNSGVSLCSCACPAGFCGRAWGFERRCDHAFVRDPPAGGSRTSKYERCSMS